MPAILDGEEAVSKWLDFGQVSTQEALKLIHPTENITFHPVSIIVNNSRNNTPECLAPADLVVKKVRVYGFQSSESFQSFQSFVFCQCGLFISGYSFHSQNFFLSFHLFFFSFCGTGA
jgi:hypothetical protein